MTLREAIDAATDSAGRIHSTRALALAIEEADARLSRVPVLADDLLYGTRTALCKALALPDGASASKIVFSARCAVETAATLTTDLDSCRRERDEAARNARAWADERDAMRRERDEAAEALGRMMGERDEARAELQRQTERADDLSRALTEVVERMQSTQHLSAQLLDAERERDEARRELADLDLVLPAACGSRVDAAQTLVAERDEARAEAERLRVLVVEPIEWRSLPGLSAVTAAECERLVREAEERGARVYANAKVAEFYRVGHFNPPPLDVVARNDEAARICAEARERGEHG